MRRWLLRKVIVGPVLFTLLLVVGGAWYYYDRYLPAQAAPAPALKTTTVRRGDITLTAIGTGTLLPAAQADLGFKTGGQLVELNVQAGDQVATGDILARLDDADAWLQVSQAEIALRQAELKLDELTREADPGDLAAAQANLTAAWRGLEALQAGPGPEEVAIAQADLKKVEVALQQAQSAYDEIAWRNDVGLTPQAAALQQATLDYAKSKATYDLKVAGPAAEQLAATQAQVAQAQAQLDTLVTGATAEAVETAQLQVEQARNNMLLTESQLANTVLRAPFAGAIAAVKAAEGEMVGTAPMITLVDLTQPAVVFYVEESDLGQVGIGYPVEITFDALPDEVFTGTIESVNPVLTIVDNVPAAEVTASVEADARAAHLWSGMSAGVEIIAASAKNALLVPVEALRELAPGQYAVFVVAPDDTLEFRPVEVGLKDYTNAEIQGGLTEGERVSTGTVPTE